MSPVLLVHVAATLFMTGLIWFVQLVHYPLFGNVDRGSFPRYEVEHMRRTGWVVMPAMGVELLTAVWIALRSPGFRPWIGLGLLGVIWLSTALLQAPRHVALRQAFDGRQHAGLVQTNWIRTLAWSLRAGLVLWMVAAAA